jgi:hypothetical protein
MVPGTEHSPIDLIGTDTAARWIARAATQDVGHPEVCHVAAGRESPSLGEFLDTAAAHFRTRHKGWARGQITRPIVVDRDTFDLFQRTAARSSDLLFTRVLESAGSFVPALLYPKVYQTARAEGCWGGPLQVSGWQETLAKVIDFGCARHWSDRAAVEARDA